MTQIEFAQSDVIAEQCWSTGCGKGLRFDALNAFSLDLSEISKGEETQCAKRRTEPPVPYAGW